VHLSYIEVKLKSETMGQNRCQISDRHNGILHSIDVPVWSSKDCY